MWSFTDLGIVGFKVGPMLRAAAGCSVICIWGLNDESLFPVRPHHFGNNDASVRLVLPFISCFAAQKDPLQTIAAVCSLSSSFARPCHHIFVMLSSLLVVRFFANYSKRLQWRSYLYVLQPAIKSPVDVSDCDIDPVLSWQSP